MNDLDPNPKGSQVGFDPMDIDLNEIQEDEPEEENGEDHGEAELGEEVPKVEFEDEQEDVPPVYDYNPYYMPEVEPVEEYVEQEQDEILGEFGDINHLIEIEAESKSSVEATIQEESDSGASELDSEWTPSRRRKD